MSQATLYIAYGGQERHKETLMFHLDKQEGELKKAMEIKRVVRWQKKLFVSDVASPV